VLPHFPAANPTTILILDVNDLIPSVTNPHNPSSTLINFNAVSAILDAKLTTHLAVEYPTVLIAIALLFSFTQYFISWLYSFSCYPSPPILPSSLHQPSSFHHYYS
jgi:hypothetical protein